MSKEFKITKEKILAMAEECEEAKAVLKKGFPEAFEVPAKIEKWVEVTEKVKWRTYDVGGYYWVVGTHDGEGDQFYFNKTGIHSNHPRYEKDFKIEIEEDGFHIYKKM